MKPLALLSFAAVANVASAQYTIDWHTMDAGAGNGTAGAYAMQSTLGQPDAFTGVAGTTELRGGFWSFPDEVLPVLRIFMHQGDVVLAWPNPSSGFVLEATPDLATTQWTDVPYPPTSVGDEWMINWGPPVGNHFFRLRRP